MTHYCIPATIAKISPASPMRTLHIHGWTNSGPTVGQSFELMNHQALTGEGVRSFWTSPLTSIVPLAMPGFGADDSSYSVITRSGNRYLIVIHATATTLQLSDEAVKVALTAALAARGAVL